MVLDSVSPTGDAKVRDLLQIDCLHMRNDGRCAALAERHFGVGKDGAHAVMAMLTLGTGIGGALIHDASPASRGVLFDGCTFDAGDFGHHVMRSGTEAFKCVCGNYGCFEQHASATARPCALATFSTSFPAGRLLAPRHAAATALARDPFLASHAPGA